MLGKMWEIEQFAGLDSPDSTPESICACVAKIFHVRETEVALLEVGGSLLNFLYPAELKTAGAIPLSSSAVAARTARTKQAELFNSFTQVKHLSIFELVKLGDSGLDEQVIQKLMSAPVLATNGEVIGVIQVSRKAPRPAAGRTRLHRRRSAEAGVGRSLLGEDSCHAGKVPPARSIGYCIKVIIRFTRFLHESTPLPDVNWVSAGWTAQAYACSETSV